MSADFHIFVRECPSKIGIQRFHVPGESSGWFPSPLLAPTSSPKVFRPSPIADGQSSQTAGRKREVQDEDSLIMVPKSWCRGSRLIPTDVLPS